MPAQIACIAWPACLFASSMLSIIIFVCVIIVVHCRENFREVIESVLKSLFAMALAKLILTDFDRLKDTAIDEKEMWGLLKPLSL